MELRQLVKLTSRVGCPHRLQFTVRIGTIFEDSHIDLHLGLQAIYLMTSSKNGISANQLHRTLGITLKSAWFMGHRIREAMRDDGTVNFGSGAGRSGRFHARYVATTRRRARYGALQPARSPDEHQSGRSGAVPLQRHAHRSVPRATRR